jgi:hypothetical protein
MDKETALSFNYFKQTRKVTFRPVPRFRPQGFVFAQAYMGRKRRAEAPSSVSHLRARGKSLSGIEGRHWKATFSAHVRWGEHGAPVQNHRPWLQEEFGRIPFELELKRKPQISPLRCAPVEMTILFEDKFSGFQEKCAL